MNLSIAPLHNGWQSRWSVTRFGELAVVIPSHGGNRSETFLRSVSNALSVGCMEDRSSFTGISVRMGMCCLHVIEALCDVVFPQFKN
jgi:hypothetical protein